MAETTGAHVVVQNLIAQGVRRVYVLPGELGRPGGPGLGRGRPTRPAPAPLRPRPARYAAPGA